MTWIFGWDMFRISVGIMFGVYFRFVLDQCWVYLGNVLGMVLGV